MLVHLVSSKSQQQNSITMRYLFVYGLLLVHVTVNANPEVGGVMTEAMQKGIVKLGEACMKKIEASMDEMNALRDGPPYKGKTACVVACILDKAGIIEKKKFSKQGFIHAAFPFIFTDPKKLKKFQEIGASCDEEINTTDEDECEVANHIIMCLRKNIPQIAEIKF